MNRQEIAALKQNFDLHIHVLEETGIEYCFARELMNVLGYERWENFSKVIERATTACINSNIDPTDHFRDVTKMVSIGSGAERPVNDILSTHYVAETRTPRKIGPGLVMVNAHLQLFSGSHLEELSDAS